MAQRNSTATVAVLAGCVALTGVVLAGCTSGNNADQPAKSKDWHDIDACSLLTSDDVAGYLGKTQPSTTTSPSPSTNSNEADLKRPNCHWPGQYDSEVSVTLWQPPSVDVETSTAESKRTVDGLPAYVRRHSEDAECDFEIAAKPAWVEVDVNTAGAVTKGNVTASCDNVAKTAAKVLTRLGWNNSGSSTTATPSK